MAKKSTAAPVEDVTPAVEETEETERDYTALMAKEPGELYAHLLGWIIEKTGITFATKKEQDAFAKGVEATLKLRTYHQASPENQERLAEAKEAAAAAKLERQARKAAKANEESADEEAKPAKKAKPTPVAETAPAATPATVAKGKAKGPVKAGAGTKKAPF